VVCLLVILYLILFHRLYFFSCCWGVFIFQFVALLHFFQSLGIFVCWLLVVDWPLPVEKIGTSAIIPSLYSCSLYSICWFCLFLFSDKELLLQWWNNNQLEMIEGHIQPLSGPRVGHFLQHLHKFLCETIRGWLL